MAGFVRRFTFVPGLEVITEIEGTVIIDLAPPAPVTGAGTGAVLIFGEFEDGPFASDPDEGPLEVFGSEDLRQKFGALGYTYDGVVAQNASARRHLAEDWNGNGFIKLFRLRAQRLFVARVDTSVGTVSFDPLACVAGGSTPFQLADAQTMDVITDAGGPATSDPIAASPVLVEGRGAAFATILSGDTVGVRVDGGPQVNVVFGPLDTTQAAVISRINTTLGYTAAAVAGAEIDVSGLLEGNRSSIEWVEVTPGALAKIGHAEGLFRDVGRVEGAAPALGGIAPGDNFDISFDGGTPITVTFAATPATVAEAIGVINSQVGATVAYELPDGTIRLDANGQSVLGSAGSMTLATGTPDALVDLGHGAGTFTGDSNVGDVNNVTPAEVAAIINGSAALTAIQVEADVGADGELRVCNDTPGGTVRVVTGPLSTALELSPLDTTVSATDHSGGSILAGTRVRNAGGDEWVTMQTLDIPEGEAGPYTVKVRPALDDGSGVSALAGTVTTLVDPADFANLAVTNPAALTVALTEPQLDTAYTDAMEATLNEQFTTRAANFTLSARRSDAVVRELVSNAVRATANGLTARKAISGDPLGTTVNQAIANVAAFRSDRLFYTAKGLKVRIPQIAERGTAGGVGFTADGVITVRPDGPLTTLCAILPPEENPGQATGLIEDFFEVDTFGETLDIEAYKAFKREGIAAPRVDRVSGTIFQSGVTSSLVSGRTTMARRKMADFIQDTAAEIFPPFAKKLNKESRRDQIRGLWEGFLAGLASEQNAELQRIDDFRVDDGVDAGNTAESLALGVYRLQTQVRTLSSLDNIVVQTEIGEGVVINTEVS